MNGTGGFFNIIQDLGIRHNIGGGILSGGDQRSQRFGLRYFEAEFNSLYKGILVFLCQVKSESLKKYGQVRALEANVGLYLLILRGILG